MREFMLIPEVIFIYDRRLKDLHSVNMLSVLICSILLVTARKGFSQSQLCTHVSVLPMYIYEILPIMNMSILGGKGCIYFQVDCLLF